VVVEFDGSLTSHQGGVKTGRKHETDNYLSGAIMVVAASSAVPMNPIDGCGFIVEAMARALARLPHGLHPIRNDIDESWTPVS